MLPPIVAYSSWPNAFDFGIEQFLNHFVHKSYAFDWSMNMVVGSFLFRGGGFMLFVWYALFDKDQPGQLRKGAELFVGTIPGSLIAVPCVRTIARCMPFRLRPIATPGLHFIPPTDGVQTLINWSSFPSDHAVFFFLAATGVFFMSRRIGVLAYLWVALVICFPRLYMGFHWPTDILAGGLLGVGLAWTAMIPPLRRWTKEFTFSWHSRQPGLFFAAMFFYTFQVGTMYQDTYPLVLSVWKHFA